MWGASIVSPDRTRFGIWAPGRDALTLELDDRAVAMTPEADGWFTVETAAPIGTRYRYRVNEDLAVPDPASRRQYGGVHGWSVVAGSDPYRWETEDWRGRPWEEAIIQEVHVGALGGFNGVTQRLPALADLGITAIELMPINAFGGARSWGYDGVLPFAPAESYGTPDDLRALIDRAHALGLMVFLDVVYNHFGPDGNYLGAYAPDFFDADIDTPWGGAVAVERAPVHQFFLENALMWLRDYLFDGLRFDAVHAIGNDAFLDCLAQEIRQEVGPDRHVHLVLENENNDADRLCPSGFDAQWNDDFHNVMHVLLTGESSSYYGDFAERPAEKLARCLGEGFIYQGEGSPNHDGKPRGKPSGHLPATAFVSFLQNHDQIGNRAMGERLTLLTDPKKLRAATVLLLLCPQIPLFFMGDEYGSQSPFLFFTDFHDALADAVREGRRREFSKFAAFADRDARSRIPDPNALETFARSVPEEGADAKEWRALYRQLIALRHNEIVPRLSGARAAGAEVLGDAAVIAHWTMADGATLSIVINLGNAAVNVPDVEIAPLHVEGEVGAPSGAAVWLRPA